MKVFYLTARNAATSIPLELAEGLAKEIDIDVCAFYPQKKSDNAIESFNKGVRSIAGPRLFGTVKGVFLLSVVILKSKADIVHVHHSFSALVGAFFAKVLGKKLIKTEHNDHKNMPFHQAVFNFFILILADKVICNSTSTLESFSWIEKKLSAGKSSVVYNGVNFSKINEKVKLYRKGFGVDRSSSNENVLRLVSVARLVPQKNIENLVKAISELNGAALVELRVVGGGALLGEISKKITQLRVDKQVKLMGAVSREEVLRQLAWADAFIISSKWEGFCNAAVEAMASELPLVCSDIETLREVVGPKGMYFNPDDPADIASAILKLYVQSKDGSISLGPSMREWSESRYSLDASVSGYLQHYRELTCD